MHDTVETKGFHMILALVVFAIALAFVSGIWFIAELRQKDTRKSIDEKQLVTMGSDYIKDRHILTVGEVIDEIKTLDGVVVYVNGNEISEATIKDAKLNPELFNQAPFHFIITANYNKEYGYDPYGKIVSVSYTME